MMRYEKNIKMISDAQNESSGLEVIFQIFAGKPFAFYTASDIFSAYVFSPDVSIPLVIAGCDSCGAVEELEKVLTAVYGGEKLVEVWDGAKKVCELKISDFVKENGGISSLGGKHTDFGVIRQPDAPQVFYIVQPISLQDKSRYDFSDLERIMKRLLAPDGCEWDKAQTHESIRANLLEEAYELAEAIDLRDDKMMCEEAGDVLLQAVFHAEIAKKRNAFDTSDVLSELCHKLISRHTHIFGSDKAKDAKEALAFWDAAKKDEKNYLDFSDRLDKIAKTLPALTYSYKVQKVAKKSGFDWSDINGAYDKLLEEIAELKEAVAKKQENETEKEAGDVLFAAVNILRFLNIDPEFALSEATKKFVNRFKFMEKALSEAGKNLTECTLDEMEQKWQASKKFYP